MSDLAELLVIRHGRAHCTDNGTIAAASCTGLTPAGRDQAAATARRLAARPDVRAVHASTTLRAMQTAETIAEAVGLTVTPEHSLRVPDPGNAEGTDWQAARARWPHDPHHPSRPAAPRSEAWVGYLDRATATLRRLLDNHPGGTIVVVGHSETLTAMLHLLLDAPTLARLKLTLDHGAITTWQATTEWPGTYFPYQRWTLLHHNDTGHLLTSTAPTTSEHGPLAAAKGTADD